MAFSSVDVLVFEEHESVVSDAVYIFLSRLMVHDGMRGLRLNRGNSDPEW